MDTLQKLTNLIEQNPFNVKAQQLGDLIRQHDEMLLDYFAATENNIDKKEQDIIAVRQKINAIVC